MHKSKLLCAGLLITSMLLSGCAARSHSIGFNRVPPGYLFEGNYINVHAPNSPGWHLLSSSPAGIIEFARFGEKPTESLAAQVLIFPLPKTQDWDEFLSNIKNRMQKGTNPERFRTLTSDFSYSDKRSYPCIDASVIVEDKNPQTLLDVKGPLLLQTRSLYCRHPVLQDTGFAIIYSFRGPNMYANLDSEAKLFIDGAQVPEK